MCRVACFSSVSIGYNVVPLRNNFRCLPLRRLTGYDMIDFATSYFGDGQDILLVELSGRLDTDTADQFFARLEEEVSKGHTKLVFDCKKLEHISSLGFGMMIRAHSRLQAAGGAVRFARLEGMIGEAFRIVGFHKLVRQPPHRRSSRRVA